MLTYLLLMTLVLSVSLGNIALGFGTAVHFGHGPAGGWQALCFWNKPAPAEGSAAAHTAPIKQAAAAPSHH